MPSCIGVSNQGWQAGKTTSNSHVPPHNVSSSQDTEKNSTKRNVILRASRFSCLRQPPSQETPARLVKASKLTCIDFHFSFVLSL